MPAVRAFAGALAFLTRIPVPFTVTAADVARGAVVFPVVGAGIGASVGVVADVLARPLTAPLAAVLAVALGAALTGALHLDGLADTADALGGATRERALEIMRDHAIGAYGAVALVLGLATKLACVAALAARGDALRYVTCAVAAARVVPVVLGVVFPYARSEGAAGFMAAAGRARALVAFAIVVALCVLLHAWPLAIVTVCAAVVCGVVARRWLGGVTGDVLGAAAEVTELAALVAAVALT